MRENGSAVAAALDRGHTMSELRNMSWEQFVEATGIEPRTIAVRLNGRRYACLDVAYWDPEKKKPTHRRKTIGYYDESGELILTGSEKDTRKRTAPRPEVYASIREIGQNLLFDSIADRIGLLKVVRDVFESDSDAVLTCAYYLAGHSGSLCHCEQWSAGSETPLDLRLADQRISELLKRITVDRRARFFREWIANLGDDDNYALDITSISSYSELIAMVRAGYNRDKEDLEQVNLALMVGSKSRLPAHYSIIPGNINDKTSLKRFLHTLKAYGFEKFSIVTDKGFFSKGNVDEMYRLKQRFVISIENGMNMSKGLIDGARDEICNFDNYYDDGASQVYCITRQDGWTCSDGTGHRCYFHIIFDPKKKEDDVHHFTEKLNLVRNGILKGDSAYASSPIAKKYFKVTGRDKKINISANQGLIEEKNAYSGFLIILSNHVKDSREALRIYRDKETAESAFDDMKNGADFRRLRIHSESAMEGKAFLVFLSLIIRLEMSNVMLKDQILRSKSRSEILEEMSLLRCTTIGGKNAIYTERTKLQKAVIKAFGIKTPFKDVLEETASSPNTKHS